MAQYPTMKSGEKLFSEKIFPPRNVPIGGLIAVLTTLPKTCRQVTDDSSLNVQKMKKKTNQTCSKQFFFSKPPFGHVENNFENPVVKKWQKNYTLRHKYRKWLKNTFLRNFFFRRIFWSYRKQFWHLFRNIFARRPISFSSRYKDEKDTEFYQNQNLIKNFL